MAKYLKRGRDATLRAEDDHDVRVAVEAMLADIENRGDEAVRDLSVKFDKWDRADYRLTDAEIKDCWRSSRSVISTTSSSRRPRFAILPNTSAIR